MPKTVLLADDSVTIQHAVGISLANEDIALVNVNNGEDAVIKARALKPDLILLDVVMPKVSGYDACKQIRQDPSIKHTPIIMLVGAIEGFDEQKFKESMANDYIIKPFESGALINKIRKFLYPELSRPAVTQPQVFQTAQQVASPTPVIPNIPIPQVPKSPVATPSTNPQIPIPPKPAVPPVVPPIIPQTQPVQSAPPQQVPFTSPPVPPIPPHLPIQDKTDKVEPVSKGTTNIANLVDNLITPPKVVEETSTPEMVDEISPAEIEEITSEIPELEKKEQPITPPSIVDIVSQVDKSVGIESLPEVAPPPQESAPAEPPKAFDMEEWGKDLKKEIMEASGLTELSTKVEDKQAVATPPVEIVPPEEPVQMQVETIAESISTEPVGEQVKPVDITPTTEIPTAVEVEPTSLVEKKIDLCSPLSEEAIKQVREVVERVVWEIVPELAEKLIKEEIKRLMSEKED